MRKVFVAENMKTRHTYYDGGNNGTAGYSHAKFYDTVALAEQELEAKAPEGEYGIRPVLIKEKTQ